MEGATHFLRVREGGNIVSMRLCGKSRASLTC